jgi:hypothetical protein
MSYDFHLFRRVAGEDPLTTARAQGEDEDLGPPDPDVERIKKAVADALVAQNPGLEAFDFDYEEIGRFHDISADEARQLYGHIELNCPERGNGIQVTLFDHTASITLPYWHSDSATAKEAMTEIWGYLRIMCREGGFLAYDPQLDRVLDLSQDFDQVTSTYLQTARRLA